jgi:hypothetical protein
MRYFKLSIDTDSVGNYNTHSPILPAVLPPVNAIRNTIYAIRKMQILLTNDDGIFAPGLAAIYKELVTIGDVTVVAPADSRSGASHSITYSRPLVCNKVDINGQFTGFSVQGSPADCVKLAVMQLH